jgi:TonB family protein
MKHLVTLSLTFWACFQINAQTSASSDSVNVSAAKPTTGTFQDIRCSIDSVDYQKWQKRQLRYPKEALNKRIESYVFIRFVADTAGRVSSAEPLPGTTIGYGLEEEAIRVIKLTQWQPATHRGRAVRVRKVQSIWFGLKPPRKRHKKYFERVTKRINSESISKTSPTN